jgi:hypothetical protein
VIEPLYVWQENSQKIRLFLYLASCHHITRDNINNACSKLEHVITDAADSCLKRPKLKNNKRKGLSYKKWYDCDLKKHKHFLWSI